MSASCENIWEDVLSDIEGRVSPATFNLWFRDAKLLRLDKDACTIGVSNSYAAEWLKKHFSAVVGKSLNASLDREVKVKFSVVEKKRPDPKRDVSGKDTWKEKGARKKASTSYVATGKVLRLEEFVVGPSNQLAYMSALEMLREPAPSFNTLFIYGSVGLGKTHILQGIYNRVNENGHADKAIYMPAEHWTNEYISAIKKRRVESFRDKYRRADVLLIDDVHFLSNKSGIQEEFLHTFNTLYHSAKRIIFASDAHPKLIKKIKQSLASRMMSGMVAEIHPPDYETSVAILRAKAKAGGKELPAEVLGYMAERLQNRSVREFESALTVVTAVAEAYRKKVNISLVRDVFCGMSSTRLKKVRIEDIEKCVAEHFQVSDEELRSPKKKRSQILPIHLCCYLARLHTTASYQEIGCYFGNRRHSTCISAIKKIKTRLKEDKEFRELVESLSEAIRPGSSRNALSVAGN